MDGSRECGRHQGRLSRPARPVVPALAAAELCARYKLSTADAIVYATALGHGADLLTCDRHFEGLPNVVFFPKTSND